MERMQSVSGEVVCQDVVGSWKMDRNKLKITIGLSEEDTAQQVHHMLIFAIPVFQVPFAEGL